MGPALPLDLLADEPQIRLVNQGRRLKSVPRAFALEVVGCDPSQLAIDELDEALFRIAISASQLGQNTSDFACRFAHPDIPRQGGALGARIAPKTDA